MNHNFILIILILTMNFVSAHKFDLPDGRSIEATILSVDDRSGIVELERADGKIAKVKTTVFIEEDQFYIKNWVSDRLFVSPVNLQIETDNILLEQWKEEEYADIMYTDGNVDRELMKETRFKKELFEITLKNRSNIPFEGLYIEYIIFYEQSNESYDKPVINQLIKRDKLEIKYILEKSNLVKKTDDITTFKDNIMSKNWTSGRSRTGGKGDVHGLRARLCKKMLDGTVAYREFSNPKSLSTSRYPWPD